MSVHIKLPSEAPIVSYKNMCKHVLYDRCSDRVDGYNKCCLLGHIRYNLLNHNELYTKTASMSASAKKVTASVEKKLLHVINEECGLDLSIVRFNDSYATPSLAARVWNRTMYLLGYTQGNPESKSLKRRG